MDASKLTGGIPEGGLTQLHGDERPLTRCPYCGRKEVRPGCVTCRRSECQEARYKDQERRAP